MEILNNDLTKVLYKKSYLNAIHQLFYDTVHRVCKNDYTEAQLNAWAPKLYSYTAWHKRYRDSVTIIFVKGDIVCSFGNIEKSGYLDMVYVNERFQGVGLGGLLCNNLEDIARMLKCKEITTCASITAKGFFEKRGYKVVSKQQVEKHGQLLTNFLMKKDL